MIYLTGQLLAFLIVTASIGFVLGWILRGAILHTAEINHAEILVPSERPIDKAGYVVSRVISEKGSTID